MELLTLLTMGGLAGLMAGLLGIALLSWFPQIAMWLPGQVTGPSR